MIVKKMPNEFFVVSLDFETGGCDDICFNAIELKNTLDKYMIPKYHSHAKVIIKKYKVCNNDVLDDLWQNEFMQMFFDNIEWVMEGVQEIEEINIDL